MPDVGTNHGPWLDTFGDYEVEVALGHIRGRRADLELLNNRHEVVEAAAFFNGFVGARSLDSQDVGRTVDGEHPSSVAHSWLASLSEDGSAKWAASLEHRTQRHACKEAPPIVKSKMKR